MVSLDINSNALSKTEVFRLEDEFLRRLNVMAGLPAETQYGNSRIRRKTRIDSVTFGRMVDEARTLSQKISVGREDGINVNWPFDVLAAYFAHRQ